jgi:rubredoxin
MIRLPLITVLLTGIFWLPISILEILMKKYQCIVCGWIYDEATGWPEDGIAPGTKWEDVPNDWTCPDCGVSKADFEMIEV